MAKRFDIRKFLFEKTLIEIGERTGRLPQYTSEAAFLYLARKPIKTILQLSTMGVRVALHVVLPKPVAPPVTQSYTGIRGGHPGTIPRSGGRKIPFIRAGLGRALGWASLVWFFATVESPGEVIE